MNNYCYHSPWCEPDERCCCEAYAKYEKEQEEQKEEEDEEIDRISDDFIKLLLCWTIAGFFALMVAKELFL